MKKKIYEVIFAVTETTNRGNERRIKKAVFMPIFGKDGRHLPEPYRIERGTAALRAEHFYDIEYVETVTKTLIITEDGFPTSY